MSCIEKEALEKRVEVLEKLFDTILHLTVSVESLTVEIKYMRENMNTLTTDVKENISGFDKRLTDLEAKPVKKYDAAITTAITAVVGAIVAAIVSLILK